ncbi:MAG: 3-isopropylmalate dehydratase small subunit [Thermostichales cyanobacterium SZTDM-1c_bins_54]
MTMDSQIRQIQGRGIPLLGDDIDTDRIIPARFLRCVTFEGLGEHVFADDRAQLGGQHPFDLPQFQGATILVVNGNFGCGSSREHAPQALARWGIRGMVGVSFAEIFAGNCLALGIPCVTAAAAVVREVQSRLLQDPAVPMVLDVVKLRLEVGDRVYEVGLAASVQQMLVNGTWDACGQLVSQLPRVREVAAALPYLSW